MRIQGNEVETKLLLEAIYSRYYYDFRSYAMASLRRRIEQACAQLQCASVAHLQERILQEPEVFSRLLQFLTIPVSDMFRDPEYFLAFRRHVVPILETYPSVKIWIAGCSTGEEAYSFAILLREQGLLDRTILYATDINAQSLRAAESGIYRLSRMRQFTENHRAAGGMGSLSEHYHAAGDSAVMDASLRRRITFSDHSLATDSVFSEVQFVSCRNVLIYFNATLQSRALLLFRDALCSRGFLGLGSRETLRFTPVQEDFVELCAAERIHRKRS